MGSDLRKCLALANDGINKTSVYNYARQRGDVIGTGSRWVRFWADWMVLQPQSDSGFNHPKWLELDEQLRLARNESPQVYVIVTAYRFPDWTNRARRERLGVLSQTNQNYFFTVPDDLSVASPWARFVEHLMWRYNPLNPYNSGAHAHCVEICNEPNIQMWPQRVIKAGEEPIYKHAARMMRTAKQVKADLGYGDSWPILLAPATGDTTSDSETRTPYSTFTRDVLTDLGSWQAGGWFGWSHHNHRDIELDAGATTTHSSNPLNRAAATRRLLVDNGWRGWGSPTSSANAKMFLTEGGAQLIRIREEWFNGGGSYAQLRDKQAWLLERNYNRMKTDAGEGEGVSMLSQFLATSDFAYDTGLRQAYVYGNQSYLY